MEGKVCESEPAVPASQQAQEQQARLVSPVRRRAVLGGLAVTALCSCCPVLLRPQDAAAEPFRYGPQEGQAQWEGACAAGRSQSPVDIPAARVAAALERPTPGVLKFDYRALKGATIVNSGHGAQVNVAPGNVMVVGDQQWQMVQYHFHTPSEHAIDGRYADMEAHLVHENVDTGALAVVSILLQAEEGYESWQSCAALQQALSFMSDKTGDMSGSRKLAADTFVSLIPESDGDDGNQALAWHPHVHYSGSLTTPPCTEDVLWYVLLIPRPVGATQVQQFQQLLDSGASLDLNSRTVNP